MDGDLDAFEDDGEPRAGKSDRADGPYDISEAPDGIAQLDLGALKVPAVENVEVRVQADNDGKIQQIVLVFEESALQLGVFAAPRSEGIWDEVRAEIRKQLFNDGVAAEEVQGDYGTELRARVRTPDGLTDIRFVGVDGPRWLVRAVFQGPAAVDPQAAPPLLECLRNLVVERGNEAMPVREPLSLHLPKEVTEGGAEASGAEPATPAAGSAADGGDGSASGRRRPSPRPRRK
ncbi:DUF3710 domain-containing protein [Dactylosporangium matsuzakiense]|nr:DUF3710 domain-containing protein [Dactylosporangium matsuzakiense]